MISHEDLCQYMVSLGHNGLKFVVRFHWSEGIIQQYHMELNPNSSHVLRNMSLRTFRAQNMGTVYCIKYII